MLEALGNHSQSQCLHLRHGFITVVAVAQHAGQSGNFGEPSTVVFAFKFDREGHRRNVPSRPGIHQAGGRGERESV